MARRRFGSVRKLPSGRWQARYQTNGAWHRADHTFATKTAAQRWLTLIEADLHRGDWVDPSLGRHTLAEWHEAWRETLTRPAASTRHRYDTAWRTHLADAIGHRPVGQITRDELRRLFMDMAEAGAAAGTISNVQAVLRLVLGYAMEEGAIRANPATRLRLPRPRKAEMHFLNAEEVWRLAHAIGDHWRAMILMAAFTGLRAGELEALRVRNLDLVGGRVTVSESAGEVSGERIVGEPKNYQRRTVPLPSALVDELMAHMKRRGPLRRTDLVFVSPEGEPIRHTNFIRRQFKPAVIAAGLEEGVRFHDLRHTYAALLIAEGAHALAVKNRLGHSTITVTLDRYGHLFPHVEEHLTDALDATIRAGAAVATGTYLARQDDNGVSVTARNTA